jgi:hypothetical protein
MNTNDDLAFDLLYVAMVLVSLVLGFLMGVLL